MIFLVLLVSFILIGVLIFLYLPQILNFTNVNAIVDAITELKLNEFGDFVGGTLNPLLSFLTLIILLRTFSMQKTELDLQREELQDTKELLRLQTQTQVRQQFESTFFALLNVHNQILSEITENPIPRKTDSTDKEIFNNTDAKSIDSVNKKQDEINNKSKLEKMIFDVNYFYDDEGRFKENKSLETAYDELEIYAVYQTNYFHILFELLKYIHKLNLEQDELVYARIIRATLKNSVLRLLVIYAHKNNEEYRKLIERYSIFENASFNPQIADDDEFPAVSEAVKFYDKKAFGL